MQPCYCVTRYFSFSLSQITCKSKFPAQHILVICFYDVRGLCMDDAVFIKPSFDTSGPVFIKLKGERWNFCNESKTPWPTHKLKNKHLISLYFNLNVLLYLRKSQKQSFGMIIGHDEQHVFWGNIYNSQHSCCFFLVTYNKDVTTLLLFCIFRPANHSVYIVTMCHLFCL